MAITRGRASLAREGTGNKLVYVFDRSASTDGYQGRPLAAAKRELIASLDDLQDIHQFQIVFYNERPTVFNPAYPQPPKMLFGDSPTKRLAKNFVRGIVSAGSTRHLDALKLALGMRPDVIFFLTDAGEPQLSANQVDEVRQRNLRVGAQINTIEFGAGPNPGGRNFLVRLADENGGQYVYVDVTRLPVGGRESGAMRTVMPRPTEPGPACRRRELRMMRRIVWGWTWLVVTAPGWAEDVVVIARGDPPGESRRTGEILDYTGEALTLQVAGGRKEQIPAARVVSFEITKVPDHQNADQLYEEGRYADAVVSYRRRGGKRTPDLGATEHPVPDDLVLSEPGAVRSGRRDIPAAVAGRPEHALVFLDSPGVETQSTSSGYSSGKRRAGWRILRSRRPRSWEPAGCWPRPSASRRWRTLQELASCPDPRVALLAAGAAVAGRDGHGEFAGRRALAGAGPASSTRRCRQAPLSWWGRHWHVMTNRHGQPSRFCASPFSIRTIVIWRPNHSWPPASNWRRRGTLPVRGPCTAN